VRVVRQSARIACVQRGDPKAPRVVCPACMRVCTDCEFSAAAAAAAAAQQSTCCLRTCACLLRRQAATRVLWSPVRAARQHSTHTNSQTHRRAQRQRVCAAEARAAHSQGCSGVCAARVAAAAAAAAAAMQQPTSMMSLSPVAARRIQVCGVSRGCALRRVCVCWPRFAMRRHVHTDSSSSIQGTRPQLLWQGARACSGGRAELCVRSDRCALSHHAPACLPRARATPAERAQRLGPQPARRLLPGEL
jgi:hypothetical protein